MFFYCTCEILRDFFCFSKKRKSDSLAFSPAGWGGSRISLLCDLVEIPKIDTSFPSHIYLFLLSDNIPNNIVDKIPRMQSINSMATATITNDAFVIIECIQKSFAIGAASA